MKKWTPVLMALPLLAMLAMQSEAAVLGMQITPPSVNIQARTSVTASVPPPANGAASLGDVLDSATRPALSINPRSVALRWDPRCDALSDVINPFPITSPQATFRLNGRTVGGTGAIATAGMCTGSFGNAIFNENLLIPQSVIDAVRDAVLDEIQDISLSRAINNPVYRTTITVSYVRDFAHAAVVSQYTVPIVFSVTTEINVNFSRLSAVAVSGGGGFLPLHAGATSARNLPLTWKADVESFGAGVALTVRSDGIEYRTPAGQLIRRILSPLTQQFNPALATGRISTLTFNESLIIPMGIVNQARKLGANRLVIQRVFSDGKNALAASIAQPLGGTAAFEITRMDLYFGDGVRRVPVVKQGVDLRAVMEINYLGGGLLRATWEWAPLSPGGVPLFRPLPVVYEPGLAPLGDIQQGIDTRRTKTLVREYLGYQRVAKLYSPLLPTSSPGVYQVRLRVEGPELQFTEPAMRYYVGVSPPDFDIGRMPPLAPLLMAEPRSGEAATPLTEFKWQPVAETRVYRLEVYPDQELIGDLITAILVPSAQAGTSLSPLAMNYLQKGSSYWCRVVAINERGDVHAVSDPFILRVP